MLKYKERLDELELDVANKFSDLVHEYPLFDFAKAIIEEDGSMEDDEDYIEFMGERDLFTSLPTIEFRNDITGNVFDVHVLTVSSGGIYVVEMEDTNRSHVLKFSDIVGVYDRITLLTEMDNLK